MRTKIIHDIQRKAGNDQLTEISRHEAEGVQSCTLDRIICHHSAKRRIRDIHDSIHHAQTNKHRQDIGYQRVALQIRTEESQKSEQRKRNTTE